MDESSVTFKGSVNGLTVIMKEEDSLSEILSQIEMKITQAGKFFKGASLAVKYRGKKLNAEEERKIFSLLIKKSGAEIRSFEEDMEEPSLAETDRPLQPGSKMDIKKFFFFKGIHEGVAKFYRGTVRSGQSINFDGNVIVIGDVNPGGELVATGNVIVMGSLRGMVHAGSDGNKEAIVAALNLQPTQLRIAEVITRSPDEKGVSSNFVPELAYIKEDMVYIERFLPQR